MPACPHCESPLPDRGRTTCPGCGRAFHWRKDRGVLIPMRGPDQDAVLLATFASNLLLAVQWQSMVARAPPR